MDTVEDDPASAAERQLERVREVGVEHAGELRRIACSVAEYLRRRDRESPTLVSPPRQLELPGEVSDRKRLNG
jgi:hypothetical protein